MEKLHKMIETEKALDKSTQEKADQAHEVMVILFGKKAVEEFDFEFAACDYSPKKLMEVFGGIK